MTTITSLAKIGRAAAADLQPAIQGQVSQGQVSRGQVSQGQVSQGQVSQGQVSHGQVFQGQVFQGRVFQGQVFLPSHEGHSELKLGSNGAEDHLPEDHLPTVIARCETRQDVQLAVRTARAHGLAISVSGGKSDPIGRVLQRGGMVIDLSAMRHVAVDPATRVAIVAGGATVNDVVAAAAAHGLTPVTGNYGAVSLAGVTLAGGYGPLLGRYGLAADNLLEAEIVLKNGQHAVANSGRNADLFWALRGGARDFGVTTSLRIRLHALPSLLSGMIFYAWSDADLVFRGYSEIASSASECLTISAGIVSRTDGNPLLFAAPHGAANRKRASGFLRPYRHLELQWPQMSVP
jgi:hypothetical protein